MRCPICEGRIFGKAVCVVCNKPFMKRRANQVTCALTKCKKARQVQMQRIWKKRNAYHFRGAARFKGEYVICKVCDTKVIKTRKNQSTCLSKECQHQSQGNRKYRDVKAEHVWDLEGRIQ